MTATETDYAKRTEEQVRRHYHIERKLADKLQNASRDERRNLYTSLYDELFRLVPDHPQLTQKASPEERRETVKAQMTLIAKHLNKDVTFLEVGSGDCALSIEVAKFVKQVYAVDVSESITRHLNVPDNLRLFISDGSSVPVPAGSVDICYSNQLMEHIHVDDAYEQLENIFNALAPGGSYFCITPNRLNGPHDISRDFDTEATGFHLKEYSVGELNRLFKNVGFSKVKICLGGKGKYFRLPVLPTVICEGFLELFPAKVTKILARTMLLRRLISVRLVGIK